MSGGGVAQPSRDDAQLIITVGDMQLVKAAGEIVEQPRDCRDVELVQLDDLTAAVGGVRAPLDQLATFESSEECGHRRRRKRGGARDIARGQRPSLLEQTQRLAFHGAQPEQSGDGVVEEDHGLGVLAAGGENLVQEPPSLLSPCPRGQLRGFP